MDRQWSVKDFQSFTSDNQSAALLRHSNVHILAGVISKRAIVMLVAASQNCVSTEHQRLLDSHLGKSNGYAVTSTHNRTDGHLSRQKHLCKYHYYVLKMSINGASKIDGLASLDILWLSSNSHP